jgi:hypothetical protein
MTFDDDQEEMIELVDSLFVYFFLLLTSYFLFRHSVHFFAFMSPSETGGRTSK